MRLALAFAFHELNLHRISLKVYQDNARAIRAYEKCGFQHEGRLRKARYRKGAYYDELIMSILQHEFSGSDQTDGA